MNFKTIHVLVINLKRCPDRRKLMKKQLENINFPVRFIDAIDGKLLEESAKKNIIDEKRILKNYKRTLTDGEIGCALSHRLAYKIMVEENISKAVILEDDVILNDNFSKCLSELSKLNKKNYIIKLDKSVGDCKTIALFGKKSIGAFRLCKSYTGVVDARGYYIDLIAAKKILSKEQIYCFADDWSNLAKKSILRLCYPQSVGDSGIASTLSEDRAAMYVEKKSRSSINHFIIKLIDRIKRIIFFLWPLN